MDGITVPLRHGWGWGGGGDDRVVNVVVRRSAEEMQAARRLMAHEANTDTDDTDVF